MAVGNGKEGWASTASAVVHHWPKARALISLRPATPLPPGRFTMRLATRPAIFGRVDAGGHLPHDGSSPVGPRPLAGLGERSEVEPGPAQRGVPNRSDDRAAWTGSGST